MSDAPDPPVRLRFGVNIGRMRNGGGLPATEAARAAEAAGFDIVTVADHVGVASPFVVLAAAAAVTERVRLRTYVLDIGFWNPGLLARDVATLDELSGGRVDLGVGAGHMRHEHEAVGLPFPPYAERLEHVAPFVGAVRRYLADDAFAPRPVQERIPVLVGAMSSRGLDVAAATADVVALTGALQVPGEAPGTFRLASDAETDAAVDRLRGAQAQGAQAAAAPLDVLLQAVVVDREPADAAAELLGPGPRPDAAAVDALLDSPFVLFARSVEDAADELVRRSVRWGIGSWCVHQPSTDAMARVIKAVRW